MKRAILFTAAAGVAYVIFISWREDWRLGVLVTVPMLIVCSVILDRMNDDTG